jgi:hypothetical protein
VAALLQLPALEHFSLESLPHVLDSVVHLPFQVLQQLQRLTHLTLAGPAPQDPDLQLLQVLTRLADLRLGFSASDEGVTTSMPASMLSGMHQLRCLSVGNAVFEPGALAGKTKLQHLALTSCRLSSGAAAGAAALLSHLQHMQQLTHLNLHNTLYGHHIPATAFLALTASSKLQHLNIGWCKLPADA